tara:strand:- start:68 stop:319 length:252 start_codon:yes stop_codon:yes gene_type:complete
MKNVIVIHERDHQDDENSVIGVATSPQEAQSIIEECYGEHTEISFRDIRDSGLEWSKVLSVDDLRGKRYEVTVCLEWFEVNNY